MNIAPRNLNFCKSLFIVISIFMMRQTIGLLLIASGGQFGIGAFLKEVKKWWMGALLLIVLSASASVTHAGVDTGLRGDDNYAGPFPVGFNFNYYGVDYTEFYVSTNGLIQFSNPSTAWGNTCLSDQGLFNTLYVFWDDLRTDVSGQPSGKIHYDVIGEAPSRQLIVQWTNMYFYGSNLPMGTFQAILNEGSNNIQFQYRYLTDQRSLGDSATIGLKGISNSGLQIGCNQSGAIAPEQSILFSPVEPEGYVVDQEAHYSFVDISGLTPSPPAPGLTYTNSEPLWTWQKIPSLNSYEIQIQDLNGEVLHSQVLGDVNTYTYTGVLLDGGKYVARVRGSINNGGTWEMWSGLSSVTTVDLTAPTSEILSVVQKGGASLEINYAALDELSGLHKLHIRAATDSAFINVFFDQDLPLLNHGSKTLQLPVGADQVFIKIQALDAAGNESLASTPFVFNVLSRPVIIEPVVDSVVERLPTVVKGEAYPGAKVFLYLNNIFLQSSKTAADGKFYFDNIHLITRGDYTIYVTSQLGESTSEPSETVEFKFIPPPPDVVLSFSGAPLASGTTITLPGVLAIQAESPVGITRIQGSIDGIQIFNQTYGNANPAIASQFIDFAQLPNGNHVLVATVTDADGGTTTLTIPFVLNLSAPPSPSITSPNDGAIVTSPTISVSGSAMAGAQVQLYLNGSPVDSSIAVSTTGGFSTLLTLTEGEHQLTARASNSRGQSEPSAAVRVTYTPSAPTVEFINPAENAVLSADSLVEVSAIDAGGIAKVELYANEQLLDTLSAAPWSTNWELESIADGDYTLRAVATNTTGKTAEASRAVKVQKHITPPPAPPLPYVVRNVSITPQMSFGHTPIQISGEVVTSVGAEPVATPTLRMVLRVQGFERRLNLVGDANGQFNYTFAPQSNDAGTYEVRIVHPDDVDYASRAVNGSFTINRLSANYSQYRLNAIRGFASSAIVNVKASVGTGASGVHWKALPADQPSGSLPPGITLEMGEPIDIAPGASAPMSIKLNSSGAAGAAGVVILKLFANESGATPRAELRLDYQLHEARPGLVPSPTALEIGVQQTKTASGQLTITNKGYSPAQNVQVQLLTREGSAPPVWASLISSPSIGVIDIGESTVIQINASPGTDVSDGYYQLQLKITADNDGGGSVPVTIAVVRDGQGGVRFKLVDIYTNTLDAQGKLIEGLSGARITLQNEALTGDIRNVTTNAAGIGEFADIPPGNYRWRISARNHSDASGRVSINAGLTANERVFLDYQVVSIEFSVTETTIRDEYDIVLEATYQTQIPAPVVLLEPLSINLPAMQQGEEFAGELTLSNYGLVRADNLKFALPASDTNYKYEFFGDMPTELPAKSRVVIPYRITSMQAVQRSRQLNMQPANEMKSLGAEHQPAAQMQETIRQFLLTGNSPAMSRSGGTATAQAAAKAASCSSYHTQSCVTYDYECASGDIASSSTCSSISRVTGSSCGSSGGGSGGSGNGGWGGGGWGGGWGGGGAAIPLTPSCTPSCDGPSCRCQGGF